jgi:HSP20 family protein
MANITRSNEQQRGQQGRSLRPQGRETGILRQPGFIDPWRMLSDMLRWDPFADIDRGLGGQQLAGFSPPVNLRESPQSYVFSVDLPGVKEENVDVNVTANRLTISGQREDEKTEEGDRYHAYESTYGSFMRSFSLPEGTDPDQVRAEMKNGVLEVTVPKRPEVQPRKIELGQKGTAPGPKS